MSNILTTKEEVKKYLEDTAGTNQFDALLDSLILGVSQRFESASNRKLFSGSKVELHDGGCARLYVQGAPITAITSIIYGDGYDFTNGTVLTAAEYALDPSDKKNAIYSTFGVFPGGQDALKVTYVGGYVGADLNTSTVPEIIKMAATQQVIYLWKNRKTIGFDNVLIGEGVMSKVSNRWLLPEVQDVIKALRYRNIH